MKVSEVMSTEVVAVDGGATLRDAARAMTDAGVGSVLVRGDRVHILTETDAVRAGYELDRPFSEVPVRAVGTPDPVTVAPDDSVRRAIEAMLSAGVKRLPVRDGVDLVGVITVTDVAHHVPDRVREVRRVAGERDEWTA
jgi:CBS domain-containing protein